MCDVLRVRCVVCLLFVDCCVSVGCYVLLLLCVCVFFSFFIKISCRVLLFDVVSLLQFVVVSCSLFGLCCLLFVDWLCVLRCALCVVC